MMKNNIQGNIILYQNLIGRLYAGFKSCGDYCHTLSFTGGCDAGVVCLSVILVCTKTVGLLRLEISYVDMVAQHEGVNYYCQSTLVLLSRH